MSAHIDISCCNCGIDFCLPEPVYWRRRDDHKSFYCPNGHPQSYRGKTDDEKKIERLEDQVETWREFSNRYQARCEEMRGAFKECPLRCGWHSRKQMRTWGDLETGRSIERVGRDIAEHLIAEHGAHLVVGTLELEGEVLDGEVVP